MKLLDAVNLILPKLGEHPVTSLTVKHPTLAVLLPEIDNELRSVLQRGWWFNQFEYTAHPDTNKKIKLGTTTLDFTSNTKRTALRGLDLFNTDTMKYEFDEPVTGVVTQYVEFDLCPESVKQYVLYNACVNVYATDIGMSQELQLWMGKAAEAKQQMLAEHLRSRKYSTRGSRRFQRLKRALRS